MELRNEKDARFLVHHLVTEKKLLHLERGVRKLGFQSGGNKIMAALFGAAVFCLVIRNFVENPVRGTLTAIGILSFLAFCFGFYALIKGWEDARKQIHLQFEAGKMEGNYTWEYRFYDNCYEVIGKNEISRVQYSHVGRLLEFSGMYVLVEMGNVVRYFMKADVVKGDADELAAFLKQKCGKTMEFVSVRS